LWTDGGLRFGNTERRRDSLAVVAKCRPGDRHTWKLPQPTSEISRRPAMESDKGELLAGL
jgi:hypothetical protein